MHSTGFELDTPDTISPEPTITLEPYCSGRIVRPPNRFMFLEETYEAVLEEHKADPSNYNKAISNID